MPEKASTQEDKGDTVLDLERADTMKWARKPETDEEKTRSSRWNPEQPFAFAVMRTVLNDWERWSNCIYYDPKNGLSTDKYEIKAQLDVEFDPSIHYVLEDPEATNEWGDQFLNDLAHARATFLGDLTEKLLETAEKIGQPQNNVFGALGNLMRDNKQELEVED